MGLFRKKIQLKPGANLRDVHLLNADLSGVDLTEANLRGANLRGQNLDDLKSRGARID